MKNTLDNTNLNYIQKAKILERQNKIEDAISTYNKAIELNPKQPFQVYKRLGDILNKQNELEQAIVAYQKAINLQPENANIHRSLGNSYFKIGDIDKTATNYKKAIELNPEQPFQVYKRLGDILNKQGKLEQAIAAYQKATELQPENANIHRSLGNSYFKIGDIEKTINKYYKAIELNPEQPISIYQELGDILSENGYLHEATKIYQKILELKPDNPPNFFIHLGNIYSELQQWDNASIAYHKALSINSNLGEKVYFALKHSQLKQGKVEDAFKSYQKAIEQTYLINHQHKIIYCPIPKNACTLFKTLFAENSHHQAKYKESSKSIHNFINEREMSLDNFSYLHNPDYFKFVILRNPFERLVSAYLDKFAKHPQNPKNIAKEVIRDVYRFLEIKLDIYKSITFSQFVHYLARTENDFLDPHWRPQYLYLGQDSIEFDLIGQFEQLGSVISCLEEKFQLKIHTSISSRITEYKSFTNTEKFHDKYPEYLGNMDGFPKAHQLYTPELEELVRIKYAEDIKIYEQEFNLTIPSYC